MAMFSAERQLEAAKSVFEHIGEHLDARFSVELWDGTRIPLGKKVDTPFYVKIRSAGSVGSLIRRPTLENLVRAFATGDFELHGGSMLEFGDIVRSKRRRKLFKNISKGHIARNALPFLFAKDDSADRAELEHEYDDDETGRKQRRREQAPAPDGECPRERRLDTRPEPLPPVATRDVSKLVPALPAVRGLEARHELAQRDLPRAAPLDGRHDRVPGPQTVVLELQLGRRGPLVELERVELCLEVPGGLETVHELRGTDRLHLPQRRRSLAPREGVLPGQRGAPPLLERLQVRAPGGSRGGDGLEPRGGVPREEVIPQIRHRRRPRRRPLPAAAPCPRRRRRGRRRGPPGRPGEPRGARP